MEGEVCCVLHPALKNVLSLLCCAAECCTWPRARRHGAESELRWWVMAASALAVTDGQDTGWLEAGGDAPKSGVMWSDKVFCFFFHFKGKEMMEQVNRGRQSLQRYWVTSWGGRLWNEFWSWIMIHVLNALVGLESWNSSMWMLMGNGENGSTKRKMHQLPFKTSFLIKQTSLYYFIFYFFMINIGV